MPELVFNIDSTALDTIKSLSIKANFDEMKAALTEVVEPYKNMLVTEETLPLAKSDRAKLRKVVASIEDRRKLVKKLYIEPYSRFEEKCKELVAICNEGVDNLDSQVKAYEQRAKQQKLLTITGYFDAHNPVPGYLAIEDVMNPKWLNVTYALETIQGEIDNAIARTATDIDAIKGFESKHESLLLDEYKKTHDVTAVLTLKKRIEDSEKAAAAREEAKRKQEEAERLRREAELRKQQEEEAKKPEPVPAPAPVIEQKPLSELRDDEYIRCPECGSDEYHVIYVREKDGVVVGCSDCVRAVDAYEYTQEVIERTDSEYEDLLIDEAMGR